ncbi:conserved hypothetical protein [Hahella chejuensis KCTC 2396]|uniref:AraC family transcriptional regulator n=1 Tax=Hahella chejuensis (strain KCTC 2396) TaxID=349521 RepID=Q2SIV9_HAHCH|nr:conserved hypothetical protein [Hahella chejuensis KCTC 2396]
MKALRIIPRIIITALHILTFVISTQVHSAADNASAKDMEALKQRVIELNRELYKLQEEVLYPIDTQVVFFLAVDENVGFELDSVELTLDGDMATTYLYSARELQALQRGGVQRLFMGNLPAGAHKAVAVFNGRSAGDKYLRKAATLSFNKENGSKYLELRVQGDGARPPRFLIRELR